MLCIFSLMYWQRSDPQTEPRIMYRFDEEVCLDDLGQFLVRATRVRAIVTACDFPIRISATRGRDPLELVVQPRPLFFSSTHLVLRSLYIFCLLSVHIALTLLRDIYAPLNEHSP